MKLLTWNVEWADRRRWSVIEGIIRNHKPDIICLTEAHKKSCFDGYHWVEAHPEYGYGEHPSKRKVILGSINRWEDVSIGEHLDIPTGRFVSGRTFGLEIIGVCIPWRDSNVRTGRKDREMWQDHLQYLAGVQEEVKGCKKIVVGDYNQRIPRKLQRRDCYDSLMNVLVEYQIPTAWPNLKTSDGKQHIDHIALTSNFKVIEAISIPKLTNSAIRLSDHDGIVLEFELL